MNSTRELPTRIRQQLGHHASMFAQSCEGMTVHDSSVQRTYDIEGYVVILTCTIGGPDLTPRFSLHMTRPDNRGRMVFYDRNMQDTIAWGERQYALRPKPEEVPENYGAW